MSDTPRTDAAAVYGGYVRKEHPMVHIDFARQLERELAAAQKDAERYRWLNMQDSQSSIKVFVDIEGKRTVQRCFDDLDAAIDAAMLPPTKSQPKDPASKP